MIPSVFETLRWNAALGRRFLGVVPWVTLAIVGCTLVSQVAMLLAFILPVKIVFLLASEAIPRNLRSVVGGVEHDLLIIMLSAATVGVYLTYLAAERLISTLTRVGTRGLLETSGKMALFERQEEIAANAYTRFSRAVSGAVFVGVALAVVAILYVDMAVVVAVYSVAAGVVAWVLYGTTRFFRERLQTNLAATVNVFTGIGFFIAFGYLVSDFLDGSGPDIIGAVVSMVLLRQSVGRIAPVVTGLSGLQRQRTQLEALFFHGRPFMPGHAGVDRSMWPLLEKERRDEWVQPLVSEMAGGGVGSVRYQWLDLGTPNIAALGIRDSESGRCRYLVKMFEANRSAAAAHEATLLADPPDHLPAPELLGATEIQRFHAHVYSWCEGGPPTQEDFHKRAAEQARSGVLRVEPASALVNRYRRSRAMLWERLGPSTLEWLHVAVETADDEQALERMAAQMGELQALLRSLPLTVVNPEITRDALWIPEGTEQCPILLSWVKWALEPVGAGWPIQPHLLQRLGPAMAYAAGARPALADVRSEYAELAALAYHLEVLAGRQRYAYALTLLPEILDRMDALDSAASTGSVAQA